MKFNMKRLKTFLKKNKELIFLGLGVLLITFMIYAVIAVDISRKRKLSNESSGTPSTENELMSDYEDIETSSEPETSDSTDIGATQDTDTPGLQDEPEPASTTAPSRPAVPVEYKYLIKVNRVMNCITIYTKDAKGNYTVPYKAMACSVAKSIDDTPLGTFNTLNWYAWCRMVDNTYGQYAYRIKGPIMFHSVPCFSRSYSDLEWEQYNNLGSQSSLGCIRLTVANAKWLCDNCPTGTTVIIYDDPSTPGPLGKPESIKIPADSPYKGWDPTDPHKDNPWHKMSPRIEGAGTITVAEGSTPEDIYKFMKAYDTCGNPINERLAISTKSIYRLNEAGTYNITLTVTDAIGKNCTKNITLIVTAKTEPTTTTAKTEPEQTSTASVTTAGQTTTGQTTTAEQTTTTPAATAEQTTKAEQTTTAGQTTTAEQMTNTEPTLSDG